MMKFSRSFSVWIALAIAVLAGFLGIGLTNDQSQEHVDGSTDLAVEEAQQQESSSTAESGYGSDAIAVRNQDASSLEQTTDESVFQERAAAIAAQATSAGELHALAEQARMLGFDETADELEIRLFISCDAISRGDLADYIDATIEGYRRLGRYCADYMDVSIDVEPTSHARHLSLQNRDRFLESVRNTENLSPEEAIVAEIANAETPLQLHGAHLALRRWRAEGGRLPKLTGIEDFMGSSEEYLGLNGRAVQLYGCSRFSDCGPMTFKTIELCMAAGAQCGPGDGFLDIIGTFYSPHEIEVMLDLVAQFQSAENSSRDRPRRGTG